MRIIITPYLSKVFKSLTQWLLLLTVSLLILNLAGCEGHNIGMLNPKGIITHEERRLFFDTLALMLIVVLPVIVMSFAFVYHYQASHKVREYKPNWSHSYFLEVLWWGIPCVIILVLAILTWKKTYELDPFNKIQGFHQPPMQIEVIALPWKWLFIYPQQNIATINYLMLPVGQPVEYLITTDNVPMSAFFIPQLGSQIYTMTGMRSRLYLLANQTGTYDGMNTQYNGDGFSDMHFIVQVVETHNLQEWFKQMKALPNHLSDDVYRELLKPTVGDAPKFFSGVSLNLFNNVIAVYMHSTGTVHPRNQQGKFQAYHEH